MSKIAEILKKAAEVLQKNGIAESRREAGSLLAFALKKDRTFLITHGEDEISADEEANFHTILERRASREPFQYIVGKQEFYGLDFIVTPDVLIPRPETELIVENALEILKERENARFCEIGIGSGCISVSILYNVETASAIGLDISVKALEIAKKNARLHAVSERLKLELSDVYETLTDERFGLIVSNPPYIPQEDMTDLQAEVRDFEPLNALTDGADGLAIIERIICKAPQFLNPEGFLLIEIGFGQSDEVKNMFDPQSWQEVEFIKDLQGIPRMVKAQII